MTQASVVRTRLALWQRACEFWDFEITPPLSRETLAAQPLGALGFVAHRTLRLGGSAQETTLTVEEVWWPDADPLGDRRLEREGCHLAVLSWHLQIGAETGSVGAERLDVVLLPDSVHPRIHQHPYGQPNRVRQPTELPPPHAWLHDVNRRLGGALAKPDEQRTTEPG